MDHLDVFNVDGFVISQLGPLIVIPAKAGIQSFQALWIPAFAGMTPFLTFYGSVNIKFPNMTIDQKEEIGKGRR
jgi:hypothetical protein